MFTLSVYRYELILMNLTYVGTQTVLNSSTVDYKYRGSLDIQMYTISVLLYVNTASIGLSSVSHFT